MSSDNQCCSQQSPVEPLKYTFDTPGAKVTVEVEDKVGVGEDTKGYLRQCHKAIDALREKAGAGLLLMRIEKLVSSFIAKDSMLSAFYVITAKLREEFRRVLPAQWLGEGLPEQAKRIADRVELVQKENDSLVNANKNQAVALTRIMFATREVCSPDGSLAEYPKKIADLVSRYQDLQKKVEKTQVMHRNQFETLTKIYDALNHSAREVGFFLGVPPQVNGSPSERIRIMGENLLTALKANRAFANASTTIGITATQADDYLQQIRTLQQANRDLIRQLGVEKDTARIYMDATRAAHAKLDSIEVARGGNVSNRIQVFVDALRAAFSNVTNRGLRSGMVSSTNPVIAVRILVDRYNDALEIINRSED